MSTDDRTVELEEEIRFRDLLSTGTTFKINSDKMADAMDSEICDEAGSDYDEDENDGDYESKISPWKMKFSELKPLMVPLSSDASGWIYKRITTEGKGDMIGDRNCRIEWSYSMFIEGQELAIDTNPTSRIERTDITLEGHQLALGSMRQGEEAQFLISYALMYRELGCPPRIPGKADILLVAKLFNFVETGDERACENVPHEDRRKFSVLRDKVGSVHTKAVDDMRNKRYGPAIGLLQQSIRNLEFCQLANEEEQSQQERMLLEFYTELAECYSYQSNWKKVCVTVNELRRRNAGHVQKNVNILVNEAVAVSHIEGDYSRAIELMRKAQRVEPNNERVNRELNDLIKKKQKYDQDSKDLWQRAFNVKNKVDNQ